MINELFSVLKGVEQTGESVEITHGDIAEPGRSDSLRVELDDNGNVIKVSLVEKEEFSNIWTIGNGFKNQFPCAKLVFPTRPTANEGYEIWKKSNKNPSESALLECISALRGEHDIVLPDSESCWPGYRKKISARQAQLKALEGGEAEPVFELYQRYFQAENEGLALLRQVDELLWEKCQTNPGKDVLKIAAAFMFGEGLKKGLFPDGKRITLILDYKPDPYSAHFATSRVYVPAISSVLNEAAKPKTRTAMCSVTKKQTEVLADKFPKAKLPVIGNTNLYSRYDAGGNLSVVRYGAGRADAYALNVETAEKLGAVMTYLTPENKKQKNWDSLPAETGGVDLLIAYCLDAEEYDIAMATLLTGDEPVKKTRAPTKATYSSRCERVFQLCKENALSPNCLVDISIIRKINDGNQKVIYSNSASLESFEKATKSWVDGCKNVPPIRLHVKIDKQEKLLSPWVVAPKYFAAHSAQAFIRGGNDSTKVNAFNFADVMRLFLASEANSAVVAPLLLAKLVERFGPLLFRTAKSRIQHILGKAALVSYDLKKNTDTLVAVSMLGLVLSKSGRAKERYMEDLAFKLGQLLSAADELHIGYCYSIRGGQIPNTLLGNQIYGIALHSPINALSQLADRIKPYSGWANKNANKLSGKSFEDKSVAEKAIDNALYAHKGFKTNLETFREVLTANKGNQIDAQFKAELMLGYLNGRSFTKKTDNHEDSNNTEGE